MTTFSIITATYNAERFLPRLLASVFSQEYPRYELIVQDGGSTDATLSILQPYADKVNMCSEPDRGIYDAWNRAAQRVTGDWVIFLGADDCLMGAYALARCAHHLKQVPGEIDFVYGAMVEGREGQGTGVLNRSLYEAYRVFSGNMGLPFPATFVRASLLREHRFDIRYKIAGDFDFVARLFTPYNIVRIPVVVTYAELGGISLNEKMKCITYDERGAVLRTHIMPKAEDIVAGCLQHYWDIDDSLEEVRCNGVV